MSRIAVRRAHADDQKAVTALITSAGGTQKMKKRWGQFNLGYVDEAIDWLERAFTLSPDSGTNNWHLGDAYAAAGRTLEARFQWRRSLELDLDEDERALVERRLELGLDAGPPDLP